MAGEISVIQGNAIPLQAVETSKDTTKVVRATLINAANGTQIGPVITLTNAGDGLYRDFSALMPDIDFIIAVYDIYDSDGTTPNTTGEQRVSDVFGKAKAVGDAGGGSASSTCDIIVDVGSEDELEIEVMQTIVDVEFSSDGELEIEFETSEIIVEVSEEETLDVQV